MNIKEIKPGQTFTILSVKYRLVRHTGEVIDQPNRNQWGRSVGGTHKAHKVVVQRNDFRFGWTRPKYLAVADFYNCRPVV